MPARRHYNSDLRSRNISGPDGSERKYAMYTWWCPNCPWYRTRTVTESWERTIILHPVYGFIDNYMAYANDIKKHDCRQTRHARINHGINPDRIYDGTYQHQGAEL